MKEVPNWLKVVGAIVVVAVLVGASQFLLWLDKLGAAKAGLD